MNIGRLMITTLIRLSLDPMDIRFLIQQPSLISKILDTFTFLVEEFPKLHWNDMVYKQSRDKFVTKNLLILILFPFVLSKGKELALVEVNLKTR